MRELARTGPLLAGLLIAFTARGAAAGAGLREGPLELARTGPLELTVRGPLELQLRGAAGGLYDGPAPPQRPTINASDAALFGAGAATAFLAHESCHVLTGLLLGGTPQLERVTFLGFIPFFAISPGLDCANGTCTRFGERFPAGTQGVYAIVTAGFHCQHLEDEIILSDTPRLRDEPAPFRKGMLAFNTLTSIGYVLANWLSVEPPQGDIATTVRLTPAPRGVLTGLLFVTASADLARYLEPDQLWLAWVSRASKVAMGGLVLTF